MMQIESGESTPSIYKLFTLSAIYGVALNDVLSLYVDLAGIANHRLGLGLEDTRLVELHRLRARRG